jgi:hypothetical protein
MWNRQLTENLKRGEGRWWHREYGDVNGLTFILKEDR